MNLVQPGSPGSPPSRPPTHPSHLQTPYLVQMLLEPPVHLPHQIAVLHDDAPLLRLCPPQPPHQLLFAPLQQLLIVYFGDVLRRALCALGQRRLLLRCAFLHPFETPVEIDRRRKKYSVCGNSVNNPPPTEPQITHGDNSDPTATRVLPPPQPALPRSVELHRFHFGSAALQRPWCSSDIHPVSAARSPQMEHQFAGGCVLQLSPAPACWGSFSPNACWPVCALTPGGGQEEEEEEEEEAAGAYPQNQDEEVRYWERQTVLSLLHPLSLLVHLCIVAPPAGAGRCLTNNAHLLLKVKQDNEVWRLKCCFSCYLGEGKLKTFLPLAVMMMIMRFKTYFHVWRQITLKDMAVLTLMHLMQRRGACLSDSCPW